ncbi:hypothetical protein CsSME_00052890 [Camellia sinensis var. sinensis]
MKKAKRGEHHRERERERVCVCGGCQRQERGGQRTPLRSASSWVWWIFLLAIGGGEVGGSVEMESLLRRKREEVEIESRSSTMVSCHSSYER